MGEERAGESELGGEREGRSAHARASEREKRAYTTWRARTSECGARTSECGGDFGGQRQMRARELEGVGRW